MAAATPTPTTPLAPHVAKEEVAHNTIIKDAMRQGIVSQLVDSWFTILTKYHAAAPHLANGALAALKEYIGWIDVKLVANQVGLTCACRLPRGE